MATAHSTGDFSPAHAIADDLIRRVAPLAAHSDVPVTLPLFKLRALLAEAAASAATPTAPATPSFATLTPRKRSFGVAPPPRPL
ncbi:hypothetical protein [Methylomagnum sp.]